MDTRRLAYFVAVVDCGAMMGAAEILHITQPALSRHVSALEHEFGQRLLIRSGQGVVPTDAGRSLYRYAQKVLHLEEFARHEISSEASNPAGIVTIGLATHSLASTLVVPILQTIRAQYPRIVTRVVESVTVIQSQALTMAQVDAAIIYDQGRVRGVRVEPFAVDDLCLVSPLSLNLPYATDDEVPLDSLGSLKFMLPNCTHIMRKLLEQKFHDAETELDVVIEMDHGRPLADAIQLGLGVTVLPAAVAKATFPREQFSVRRIVEPNLSLTLALATINHSLSTAAEAVVEVLRQAFVKQQPDSP